jgi:hypothetical protein
LLLSNQLWFLLLESLFHLANAIMVLGGTSEAL